MYIHIGAGRVLRDGEILGVFDMDGHEDSAVNREFLKLASKKGEIFSAGEDLPRSFILTDSGVVLSHISSAGIAGRSIKDSF